MVRIILFFVLMFLSFSEIIFRKKYGKSIVLLVFAVYTLAMGLRYGQGTDYFSYWFAFENVPRTLHAFKGYIIEERMELGYVLLSFFAKTMNISYFGFVFIVSTIAMGLFYRFIHYFSERKISSLFFVYSIYSIPIFENTYRQAIAIAIVLGIVFVEKLKKRNHIAILAVFLASLFHLSAVFSLPIALVDFEKDQIFNFLEKHKVTLIIFLIFLIPFISILGKNLFIKILPNSLIERGNPYFDSSINVYAILNRVIFAFVVIYLASNSKEVISKIDKNMFVIYLGGFILYILFFNFGFISRISIYYRIVEIALIPNLLCKCVKINIKKSLLAAKIVFLLVGILFVKEMNTALIQGQYFNYEFYNYQYITVFNRKDLTKYRVIPGVFGGLHYMNLK